MPFGQDEFDERRAPRQCRRLQAHADLRSGQRSCRLAPTPRHQGRRVGTYVVLEGSSFFETSTPALSASRSADTGSDQAQQAHEVEPIAGEFLRRVLWRRDNCQPMAEGRLLPIRPRPAWVRRQGRAHRLFERTARGRAGRGAGHARDRSRRHEPGNRRADAAHPARRGRPAI